MCCAVERIDRNTGGGHADGTAASRVTGCPAARKRAAAIGTVTFMSTSIRERSAPALQELYEGFGLPPLDAMRCSCPVVVSHEGALPEVCSGAALFHDAYSPPDIAASIVRVMDDPELRARLRTLGREHARHYSWQRSARALLDIVRADAGPAMTPRCAADRSISTAFASDESGDSAFSPPSPVSASMRRAPHGALIPVNTCVFNGFILRRMRPALRASGRASGRGGAGRACPPRTGATPRAALSARNPEQERRPWRSTNYNGRRCNSG